MKLSLLFRIFVASQLILLSTNLFAQSKSLSVEVQRIKNPQGQLHYQLFTCPNSEESSWQQLHLLITAQVTIDKDTLLLVFPNLASGQYIVRVFQDNNTNGQLDFSDNGVPKEPTGFSNNPSLLLGYPKPSVSCILYDESDLASDVVVIKLNNKKKRKRRNVR